MDALEQAREAVARGEPLAAYDLLSEADASTALGFEALGLLAEVAYATGDVGMTFDAWERAHARGTQDGDHLAAATAAAGIAMHLLMDTGLLAPVRVWAKRAEQLLEGHGESPVDAVLAVVRGYERLLFGDFAAARDWGRRAVESGTAHNVAAPVALGRVMEARGVLFADDVVKGLEMLDDSAAVVLSDALDPLSVGLVYCELVCAWHGLAQHDRAEELTEAMERWCQQHRELGGVHGRCRLHRAEMLRLRGSFVESEREAMRACDELRPFLRREFGWPLTELGVIRLLKGDLDGAEEAFLQAHEVGWDPQPGLALLQLEQGDHQAAVASINDALDHPLGIPSKEQPPNTHLRRAPLLAAQVEISVAAGLLDQARTAADELERIASMFGSSALRASAAFACGSVDLAVGDTVAARSGLKGAVDAYNALAMPHEAARARMRLGQSYQQPDERHLALLELGAAASTFQRIGANRHAVQALEAVERVEASHERRPRDQEMVNRFQIEGEYWSLVFADRTVHLRDLKGLGYVARLLRQPGRELHVLDLVAAEHGTAAAPALEHEAGMSHSDGGDAGPALDDQAKAAYRRRLDEIDEDLEEARTFGDDERAARATVERDFLLRELSRAVGLGGRDRPAGAASERARVSVTRATRYALDRIRELHPALGAHLDHAIRTGTYVAYQPDPHHPIRWEL